ncbi:MAG: MmcQ/YjbR family DNA-binding protein [Flavobacteriaceae bacterium]
MDIGDFNGFCASLPATTHVVQWRGAHVWKIGGKVFAIAHDAADGQCAVTFKTSVMSYEILKDQPGCRPAPYLASRGMKWIQRTGAQSMDDAALCDYLRQSHALVAAGLSKKARGTLGL